MSDQCDKCRFWRQGMSMRHGQLLGNCHRLAPKPRRKVRQARWPVTYQDDWCGEWKAREDEEADKNPHKQD